MSSCHAGPSNVNPYNSMRTISCKKEYLAKNYLYQGKINFGNLDNSPPGITARADLQELRR